LPAVLIDFACFFSVFFLLAIRSPTCRRCSWGLPLLFLIAYSPFLKVCFSSEEN
jgi:hypothetical protein